MPVTAATADELFEKTFELTNSVVGGGTSTNFLQEEISTIEINKYDILRAAAQKPVLVAGELLVLNFFIFLNYKVIWKPIVITRRGGNDVMLSDSGSKPT